MSSSSKVTTNQRQKLFQLWHDRTFCSRVSRKGKRKKGKRGSEGTREREREKGNAGLAAQRTTKQGRAQKGLGRARERGIRDSRHKAKADGNTKYESLTL